MIKKTNMINERRQIKITKCSSKLSIVGRRNINSHNS